ncbi:unnamed protein product [Blumeria hordei]|uniref:Choline kinase N-terminal domain-containing protein n=1 Tax=Blumeria hordei TaxID=2867405 RepID=A0A383UN42_BLUHO|nr:unnamed protein product [Blumeria hordei]
MSEITSGNSLFALPALREEPGDTGNSPATEEQLKGGASSVGLFVSLAVQSAKSPSTLSGLESLRARQLKAEMAERKANRRPTFAHNQSTRLSWLDINTTNVQFPAFDASNPENHERNPSVHLHGATNSSRHAIQANNLRYLFDKLFTQVSDWLKVEKTRKEMKQKKKKEFTYLHTNSSGCSEISNQDSTSGLKSLEKLQKILEESKYSYNLDQNSTSEPVSVPRRSMTVGSRRRASSKRYATLGSDTDYQDGGIIVPSCDVFLDNPKTSAISDEPPCFVHETIVTKINKKSSKEIREWATFKLEILKLAHTLRLKGWKKVPLERSEDLKVERISGALTNAVYVVTPPVDVETLNSKCIPSRYPSKVLLRIYGPQVEHLIDRKNELSILKRLSQKKIGARMLGTFINGRFEQYLNAKPLTAKDMRMADTSVQIAKRMRELHDGVELLDREREDGPFVWRNWDKWVDRCEKIMTVLDQIVKVDSPRRSGLWKSRDFVCGVEWPLFKSAVNRYRQWLNDHYGKDGVKQKLIFAHNDTQYGNILRLIPDNTVGSSPSPLLLPANSHKQLVVIDFEYASANTPGLEFANHFTEWCYNYHEPKTPWACNTSRYPSIDEQIRFIRSYVTHQSRFYSNTSTTANMPLLDNMKGRGGEFCLDNIKMEICDFGVDASTVDYTAEETQLENEVKHQIQELLCDVRRWRVANSAQWVAWGIVQAQVPGLDHSNGKLMAHESRYTTEDVEAHELTPEDSLTELDIQEGEAGFDYLSYASDRALFFWGDMVQLGIIREEELPTELLARLKTVNNH